MNTKHEWSDEVPGYPRRKNSWKPTAGVQSSEPFTSTEDTLRMESASFVARMAQLSLQVRVQGLFVSDSCPMDPQRSTGGLEPGGANRGAVVTHLLDLYFEVTMLAHSREKRQHELVCVQLNVQNAIWDWADEEKSRFRLGRFYQVEAVPGLMLLVAGSNSGNSKPLVCKSPLQSRRYCVRYVRSTST